MYSGHTRSALALSVTTHFQVKRTTVSKLETGSLSETVVVSCPCRALPTVADLVTFGQFLRLHLMLINLWGEFHLPINL